jgi:hypothetical protein
MKNFKTWLDENHVRSVAGHVGCSVDGDANVRRVQRWSIINAVS